MNITVQAAQDIGRRKEQQDSFAIANDPEKSFKEHGGLLALVADGMGGLKCGALASRTAADTFIEEYAEKSPDESIEAALNRSIIAANEAVCRVSKENGIEGDCGTTLVATVIHESGIYWTFAGDSRIYLTDGTVLQLLTEDQNYARKLLRAAETGLVDAEVAQTHPQREALTSYLGDSKISEIGSGELKGDIPDGITLLLCTDGLYKFLEEDQILAITQKNHLAIAQELTDATLAQDHASQDNITAVVLQVTRNKKTFNKPVMLKISAIALLILAILIAILYVHSNVVHNMLDITMSRFLSFF